MRPGTKVFLAGKPIDLRNGFDGLSAKVQAVLRQDPFSGHLFVFRGKRGLYAQLHGNSHGSFDDTVEPPSGT